MNFKIEFNTMNIRNYPFLEEHFEKMANNGWLIKKIFMDNIFIYKKIEPESLDFSISLYEVEKFFTKKSKKELEEFRTVCENVGWNFATKFYDFHIYFKEKDSQAIDLETDEEEEFKSVESMAKKYKMNRYTIILVYLFIGWSILRGVFSDPHFLKDIISQLLAPIIPLYIILSIVQVLKTNKFLKSNRKNLEMGEPIKYNKSISYFERIVDGIVLLTSVIILVNLLYIVFVVKDKIYIYILGGILLGSILASLYRILVKPSKLGINYKIVLFVLVVFSAILINTTGVFRALDLDDITDTANIDGLRVLSAKDFSDKDAAEEGVLRKNTSILIPKSYDFASMTDYEYISSQYSRALTEGLAKNLVNRYKNQAVKELKWAYSNLIEEILKEDYNDEEMKEEYNLEYDLLLEDSGINKEYLANMDKDDLKKSKEEAMDLIIDKNIGTLELKDIDVDEAYFLNYEKDEILLRTGKEVYWLSGIDFLSEENIDIVKEKLGLD